MHQVTTWGDAPIIYTVLFVEIDSGIAQASQLIGVARLDDDQPVMLTHNANVQKRRGRVVGALRSIGPEVTTSKASHCIETRIPVGDTSAEVAARLIEKQGVGVTPDDGCGPAGKASIRLGSTLSDEEGAERPAAFAPTPYLASARRPVEHQSALLGVCAPVASLKNASTTPWPLA